MGGSVSLFGLDAATYVPHVLHGDDRDYPETNCYVDVLIELLHGRGDEPLAAMGCTVRSDFEGDQWTFFKPPPGDLETLFGVDIHEMQPYRGLPEQVERQLEDGRTLIVELDSWYLPDTSATSYRQEHVKTSVAVEAIDRDAEWLRYFHGRGLYELSGADYRGVFRLDGHDPAVLPPYTELVRFDAGPRLDGDALRSAARDLLRDHLAHRPAGNPFGRFGDQLADDLPQLLSGDAAGYHAYAFATVRMVGSAFATAALHADWLLGAAAGDPVAAMNRIATGCKALSFKLARRRPFDPEPAIAALAADWDAALGGLASEAL